MTDFGVERARTVSNAMQGDDAERWHYAATLRELHRVVAELNSARSLAETLQAVVDGVVAGIGFGAAVFNLVRPDRSLEVSAVAGPESLREEMVGQVGSPEAWSELLRQSRPIGNLCFIPGDRGRTDVDGVPVAYADGYVAPLNSADPWHPDDVLLAPLLTPTDDLIGVLSVDQPLDGRRPSAWRCELLELFAAHAAVAIGNARLRSDMQRALVRLERDQHSLRASEESFRQAFEYAPSGMAISDLHEDGPGRLVRVNDALCDMLLRQSTTLCRFGLVELAHPEDVPTLLRICAESGSGELRLARRDGSYLWVHLRASMIADPASDSRHLLTHVEDIEERKQRELQLAHRASHDALTGLPNSAELRSRLSRRLVELAAGEPSRRRRDGEDRGLAVLFCDLDGFKLINDRFGHSTGDAVLVEVAQRLTQAVRDGDTVARLGGDEFVVLAERIGRAEAAELANRLRTALSPPIRADGQAMRVGASFGIGWAAAGMTPDELLRAADQRMYRDKRARSRGRRTG